MRVCDVELPETHGGSILFFVCHAHSSHPQSPRVEQLLAEELAYGLDGDDVYVAAWNESVKATKRDLLELLIALKRQGSTVVGYGALHLSEDGFHVRGFREEGKADGGQINK